MVAGVAQILGEAANVLRQFRAATHVVCADTGGIHPRNDRRAVGRTDGTSCECMGVARALVGQFVERRRLNDFIAGEARIDPAVVISDDQDDVGRNLGRLRVDFSVRPGQRKDESDEKEERPSTLHRLARPFHGSTGSPSSRRMLKYRNSWRGGVSIEEGSGPAEPQLLGSSSHTTLFCVKRIWKAAGRGRTSHSTCYDA